MRNVPGALLLDGQNDNVKYTERSENDLKVVQVQTPTATRTYWLDPKRDWMPVRVRSETQHGWTEARNALCEYDGVWFPEVVQYYTSKHADGREPAQTVRIYSASFNRPDHPQRLRPESIAIDVGTPVVPHSDNPNELAMYMWDGEQVVTQEDFHQRIAAGELRYGPMIRAAWDKLARGGMRGSGGNSSDTTLVAAKDPSSAKPTKVKPSTPADQLAEWERYTRDFIQRYQLNEDQSQKALSVLKDMPGSRAPTHRREQGRL